MWDAEWLFYGGKSENFSIEDLTTSEDMFLRTEVSEDESLRVGSIPLRPIIGNSKKVLTTTTVGMYQIGPGMYEWASDLTERLVNRRARQKTPLSRDDALLEYQVNPEWVNDDTLIISRCLRDTANETKASATVILISADKRLGNQISNTCNVAVIRVDPREYIPVSLRNGWDPIEEKDPSELYPYLLGVGIDVSRIKRTYLDTGSVNAFLARLSNDEPRGVPKVRTPLGSTLHPVTGKRVFRYALRELGIPSGLRCFLHQPVQRPKRYRTSPGALAETGHRKASLSRSSLLSGKSWRKGE